MQAKDVSVRVTAILVVIVLVGLVAHRLFLWPSGYVYTHPPIEVSPANSIGAPARPEAAEQTYLVERVIDGDTLVLDNGRKVRLIGVDTPETNHPEIPVQRFGREATEFTKRMAEGMKIRVELGEPAQDSYGRELAYVFVDGMLLNKEIVRRGYGYAYTCFPHPRMDEFVAAEQEARAKQYGLWNYSLTDGRVTSLLNRYEQLSPEGKAKLEQAWNELLRKYSVPRRTGEPNDR
jgi:micrococcal nuclease